MREISDKKKGVQMAYSTVKSAKERPKTLGKEGKSLRRKKAQFLCYDVVFMCCFGLFFERGFENCGFLFY